VVYDRKLDQRNRQLLHHDVLKNTHERELVPRLKPYVIAKECVKQLQFLIWFYAAHFLFFCLFVAIPTCL
jgi:hypothetical protein